MKDDAKETTGAPVVVEVIRHPVGSDGTMTYRMTLNVSVDPGYRGSDLVDLFSKAVQQAFIDVKARIDGERGTLRVAFGTSRPDGMPLPAVLIPAKVVRGLVLVMRHLDEDGHDWRGETDVADVKAARQWLGGGIPPYAMLLKETNNLPPAGVARYRCRHTVEAVRWVDTPECREVMARWFESHGDEFVTRGSTGVLPCGDDEQNVEVGEWILYMTSHEQLPKFDEDSNWIVMDDEMFRDEYELVVETSR